MVCTTVSLDDEACSLLQAKKLASKISASKHIFFITGAGISVSSGIPDFRSTEGLYAQLQDKYGRQAGTMKGKDFFEFSFFNNIGTRPWFYRLIGDLKERSDHAEPSRMHRFICDLYANNQINRWYTQNIDGLEKKALGGTNLSKVVLLHGAMEEVYCTVCKHRIPFARDFVDEFKDGRWKTCQRCTLRQQERIAAGKRAYSMGFYRPDIVLYGEPHCEGEKIGEVIEKDLRKVSAETLLLVAGTSLKVVGVKRLVKDFARMMRIQDNDASSLSVVYINKTPFNRSEWKTVFDLELVGDCDSWIEQMLREKIASVVPSQKPAARNGRISSYFSLVKKNAVEDKDERERESRPPSALVLASGGKRPK